MPSSSVYRNTDQKVALFVDVQNMFYSARSLYQSKVDYSKLLTELVGGRSLLRAIAYVVQKPDVDQSAFLEALRRAGYEVRRKDMVLREDGSARGNWDVGMTIDALSLAPRMDAAVLVTGDGDFVPLVEALSAKGCYVEIASFEQTTSNELIRCCHEFITVSPDVLFREERFVREQRQRQFEAAGSPADHSTRFGWMDEE